jgi:hypothetical protein
MDEALKCFKNNKILVRYDDEPLHMSIDRIDRFDPGVEVSSAVRDCAARHRAAVDVSSTRPLGEGGVRSTPKVEFCQR